MLRLPVEAFSAVFTKYPESLVRVVQVSRPSVPSTDPHPSQAPVGWDSLGTHAVLMGPQQPDLPQLPLTPPISCLVASAQASATSLRVSPWHFSGPAHPLALPSWALVLPHLFLPTMAPHLMFGPYFSHHPTTLTPCSLAPSLLWLCPADHHGEAAAGHFPGTSQLPGSDQ